MESDTSRVSIDPSTEEGSIRLAREETTDPGHRSAMCALSTISENADTRMRSSATLAEETVTSLGSVQITKEDRDHGRTIRDPVSQLGHRRMNLEEIATHHRDNHNLNAPDFLPKLERSRWNRRSRRKSKRIVGKET